METSTAAWRAACVWHQNNPTLPQDIMALSKTALLIEEHLALPELSRALKQIEVVLRHVSSPSYQDSAPALHQRVMAHFQKGELRPKVGGVFQADQVAQAHEFLGMRKSTGKVILKWMT